MKAKELLQNYADGHREFRRVNLRGQSFKGKDLSGADFAEADLRDTNFTQAVLRGANFTRADIRGCKFRYADLTKSTFQRVKTGQSSRQTSIKITVAIAAAVAIAVAVIFNSEADTINYRPLATIATTIAPAIAAAFAGTFVSNHAITLAFAIFIGALFGALTFAFLASGTYATDSDTFGVALSFAFGLAIAVTVGLGFAIHIIDAFIKKNFPFSAIGSALFILLAGAAIYSLHKLNRIINTSTGNDFSFAKLNDVNFSHSEIDHSNFSTAVVDWVNWTGVRFHYCNFPISFDDSSVHRLCILRDGHDRNYQNANLRNLNLAGVNLSGVNLAEADLRGSNLSYANLQGTNLTKVQAFGTNFSNAVLTGACIENWGINPETIFTNVQCDFIYLEPNQQERKPASGSFELGDFEKLVHRFAKTLDFLFRNGIDPQAFDLALKNLSLKNRQALSTHSITNLGDGFTLLSLDASQNADKALIHSKVTEQYQLIEQQLALERQNSQSLQRELADTRTKLLKVYERHDSIWSSIFAQPQRAIYVTNAQFTGDLMPDKNDTTFINTGNMNLSGSTVNLGTIRGNVTNAINQLSNDSQPELKAHLSELQSAIDSSDLPEKGKAAALEQVKTLAEVSQNPEQPEQKGLGEKSLSTLKNMLAMLPDTAKLAEACSKLLPLIAKALGLPV